MGKTIALSGAGPLKGPTISINTEQEFHLLAMGSGTFRIESLLSDQTWQYSPDSTFLSPLNAKVELSAGLYSINILTGQLSIELRS